MGSINNYPTSPRAAVKSFIQTQTRATSIPSHLDNRKSLKEWPQSAGEEDINSDALRSMSSSPAAEDVLNVETVRGILSAIRKVMEDLKVDTPQIWLADEAAAQLHTNFDLVFSSKHSCKTFLNFQGDDAKVVLNSLQWLLDYPQSNSTQRSRLLSALLRLSRKSGLYPECIILKDVVHENDCAVASGHFGEIWKGKFRDQQVCLKVIKIYKQSHVNHLLKVFAKEAILWSQLSHPNLLPFYGIYYLEDGHGRVCLVSPWMNNGHIRDYLLENPRVDCTLLVSDVAAGVTYLHQKAIIHGDLKGVNILVTESGKACLADFGLSNHVDAEMLTWTSESSANTGGTVRWQAPEFFDPENENSKSTKETDVYAFSCVCYEIFTCQVPFHEISREPTVIAKVMGGKRPSCPAKNSVPFIEWGLTDAMWRLMQQCWDRDPENRPTMSSISGKAFLSSLVDDRPSGGAEALSPPQFRGAMHGFL
ncbi:hypothetical protein K443DRAFT_98448 [Laccaria amethystina LaAM-08-1]|uniref:Protein kinase domain-containing protein n=1 Tax=Laccaria amethystina LaAM-08-1 TaxID=1095629 RepID=A0A0C9XVA8_9AGAR|nr:hypothetical protein K443DRAFT_98448 [Laccaria amethystina LaAM-08-1]